MNLHAAEDLIALTFKVVFHEGILASAVPQVEDEVPKEAVVAVFQAQGRAKAHSVARQVVGKDDGAHRGLARAPAAHQQNFALHLPYRPKTNKQSITHIHRNHTRTKTSALYRHWRTRLHDFFPNKSTFCHLAIQKTATEKKPS